MNELPDSQADPPPLEYSLALRLINLLFACEEAAREEFDKIAQINAPDTRLQRRVSAAKLATSTAAIALAIAKITSETRHRIIVERER